MRVIASNPQPTRTGVARGVDVDLLVTLDDLACTVADWPAAAEWDRLSALCTPWSDPAIVARVRALELQS